MVSFLFALERLSDSSFLATSKRIGISYGTLAKVLKKVFTLSKVNWEEQEKEGVLRFGIDEHHFGRKHKFLVTVVNLLTGKPIHILLDDRQKTLVSCLRSLPKEVKDSIEEVCTDMKQSFISAVEQELKSARIVVDHFHIIQDANRWVNDARSIEDDVF
ncbi:MAG: transposase [Planctomycetes bacterium]|nr:transposase [Planctomycetota bacterium]